MSKEFNVGALLKDKNALINYIYDDGVKIGVVVGLKGKDRDNPLVGWCLFKEISTVESKLEAVKIKNCDNLQKAIKVVSEALENTTDYEEFIEAGAAFERLINQTAIVKVCRVDDSELYYAVEKALLRANSNRDNYFVCSNLIYGQSHSNLKAYEDSRHQNFIELDTIGAPEFIYETSIISIVRKAARAMEYRCWKYFKDREESNDNN